MGVCKLSPKQYLTVVIVCSLVFGITGLHAQDVTVNQYTAPDGTVYYYYNKGGEMGHEKDGILYLTPANTAGVSTGDNSLETRMFGVGNFTVTKDTGFAVGYVEKLEELLVAIGNQPSMKEGYSGLKDDHYFQDRKWLLDVLYCYSAELVVESRYGVIDQREGHILNPDSLEALLNNNFYVNDDVFEKNYFGLFRVYEMIANRYYNLAVKEPKGSAKRKEYAALAVQHGYEIPAKRFGEEKYLSLMGKVQHDYLSTVASCYIKADQKNSESFSNALLKTR